MKAKRNFWPTGIIAAFALFFIGMASVVVIAARHRDSLVNDSYYEQELKFQNVIEAGNRAQNSGAKISFAAGSGRLTIALPAGQLQQKLSGTVQLYRPSGSGLDREFQLEPKRDGTQTLDIGALATGLWVVRVTWNAGGQDYLLEQKITL